ncbi:MAG: c-type cytochrome, partial [Nitrospinota bacterium]
PPPGAAPRGRPATEKDKNEGFQLLLRYACRACHPFDESGGVVAPDLDAVRERLKAGWVARFIEAPQSVDPGSPMIKLGVSAAGSRQIAAALSGDEAPAGAEPFPPAAASKGETLYAGLACAGCHGGRQTWARPEGPPDLTHIGDKFQPDWLRAFLQKPSTMRFWLKVRMPDFRLNDGEADAVVRYFLRQRRDVNARASSPAEGAASAATPAGIGRGKILFDEYECAKCHPALGASLKPEEDLASLAPSLHDAGSRLRPGWVLRFLRDPQPVYPGTKMPNFFFDSGQPIEEDAEAKLAAVAGYLMTLRQGQSLRSPK